MADSPRFTCRFEKTLRQWAVEEGVLMFGEKRKVTVEFWDEKKDAKKQVNELNARGEK
jgi:hypothetical protein